MYHSMALFTNRSLQFIHSLFLFFSITAACQENTFQEETQKKTTLEHLKTYQASATELINLYGKKRNSTKVSLVAFYEGSWITVREKRRGVVSSKYYLAFQFDERTNFRIIDNSEKNGSDIELTAKFLKNGIQQNKTSKYTFFIEDSIAAEELISNFKALQKLQSAQ
jgi:hypothetical protein